MRYLAHRSVSYNHFDCRFFDHSYLKSGESGVSKKPFNLYASMSLFGMLYPMCFEYAEMVRFYHSVYRVVYHPQVLGVHMEKDTVIQRQNYKRTDPF